MRLSTCSALAVCMLLSGPTVAAAQVCAGRPGPEAGVIQLGGSYAAADGATEFGVSGGGVGQLAFGGASIGSISYDDFSGSTLVLGAGAGYRVGLGTSGNAELCPTVSGFIGSGPKDIEGSGVDFSSRGASIGVSLGYRVASGTDVAVIPTVGFGFAYSSFKLTDGVDSIEDSDTYGSLSIGVGLVLGRQFTVLPSVSIPIGLEDADPVIGVSFSLSLGTKRP